MIRVLIVDDAEFMRLTIKSMLQNNGFEIVGEAKNGWEGIARYKQFQPDVVTMDITMPEMNGLEALPKIIEFDPKAKVVMVSAMGQESMVRQAVTSGAKSFIIKPFQEETVVKILNQVHASK